MTTADNEFKVGAIGAIIEVLFLDLQIDGTQAVLDISLATTKTIKVRSPGGAVTELTGTFTTDGSDGLLRYVTPDATLLNETNEWEVQGYVVTPTWTTHTEVGTFKVSSNLS